MKVSYGRIEKKNLGNYENVTFEVRAEDYVITDCEGDYECYQRLKVFVDSQVKELCDSAKPDDPSESTMHDEVRKQIKTLIEFDKRNRQVISDSLAQFGCNKIGQLDDLQAKELNAKLERLLR